MSNQKGFSKIALIIIVLILIGGVYFVYNKNKKDKDTALSDQVNIDKNIIQTEEKQILTAEEMPEELTYGEYLKMEGWKTYRNDQFGFEIKYSSMWHYVNSDESLSARGFLNTFFRTEQSVYDPEVFVSVSNLYIYRLYGYNKKVTKDEFIAEITKPSKYAFVNFKWVKINNIDALKVERKLEEKNHKISQTNIEYYVFKADRVYEIKLSYDNNNSKSAQYPKLFETMIYTFKFTN